MFKEIVNILKDGVPRSVASISALLGVSVPTATKYLGELIHAGIVIPAGRTSGSKGRQAVAYALSAGSVYFLAVDPKVDALSMELSDLCGNVIAERCMPVEFANTPQMLEFICLECEKFIKETPDVNGKVVSACLNLGGRVNTDTGYSYSIFNFESQDEPLSETLSSRLGMKVVIENDTRAMAYSEFFSARPDHYRDALFINAGWGIGLSMLLGGRIHKGMNGYSGEIGHTYVYDNEKMCHCGKKGCLETEVSGRAICSQLQERIRSGETSILEERLNDGHITDTDIIDAVCRDDTLAIELVQHAGTGLGRQVANLINIFNPEAVIVGGSLSLCGAVFLDAVRQAVRKYSLRLIFSGVEIIPSSLGPRAGLVGAAIRARDSYMSSVLAEME